MFILTQKHPNQGTYKAMEHDEGLKSGHGRRMFFKKLLLILF